MMVPADDRRLLTAAGQGVADELGVAAQQL